MTVRPIQHSYLIYRQTGPIYLVLRRRPILSVLISTGVVYLIRLLFQKMMKMACDKGSLFSEKGNYLGVTIGASIMF